MTGITSGSSLGTMDQAKNNIDGMARRSATGRILSERLRPIKPEDGQAVGEMVLRRPARQAELPSVAPAVLYSRKRLLGE